MGMIVGWKSIARAAGFHVSTLKRWHYKECPLPFQKTEPSKQGRVMIEDRDLQMYLKYKGNPEFRKSIIELVYHGLIRK